MKRPPQALLALAAMLGCARPRARRIPKCHHGWYYHSAIGPGALLRPGTGALRWLFAAALLLACAGTALADVHYVDLNSTNATPPYTNWPTAATNIQDAVDVALAGDELVVTNGIYATGGRAIYGALTKNRIAVNKPLTLRSVNGPRFTVIQGHRVPGTTNGDGAIRCVYLANGAGLYGFTLTNGATRAVNAGDHDTSGGGLWCESTDTVLISNCVVTGNSAYQNGGGAYQGTLNNCTLTGNSAKSGGGGAYSGTLNNCTLTGNSGGGAYSSTLNNCTLTGNSGGGGAVSSTLINCTLTGNSPSGAFSSTLNNCTVSSNSSSGLGGGAYQSTLNNCTLTSNWAQYGGGGIYQGTLNNCTLSGNSTYYFEGGGAYDSALTNCTLTGNSAQYGGGAYGGTLDNCTLIGNSASFNGGAAYGGTLNNCTLTGNSVIGNSASFSGGGASGDPNYDPCILNNCIVFFNSTGAGVDDNYSYSILNYCCTTPQPTNGIGNITNAPLFVDTNGWSNLRLQSNSPCINAGNNAYAPAGPDLDGNPRIVGSTVDIGAYEYQSLDLIGFGVVSNQFGFNVTGQSNWVIVVEATSNFTNWTPLTTNTLNGSPFPFRDPTAPNLPQRFYRARME